MEGGEPVRRGGSFVSGTNNFFGGGSYATLRFSDQSTSGLWNCDILDGGGWRVVASSSGPAFEVDLRNNYWGTTSSTEIADSIYDTNDFNSAATVLFEPFLGLPVATETTSFGALKALFFPIPQEQ